MKNTRTQAAGLFAFCAAAAAFSALAFADNVSVVVRWWAAFLRAGGVSSAMPERISGFLPWFDWAAVDHSCATTFIPLLGFVLAARGAWRILQGRPADPAHFPFFRSFDQLVVALGLIGTLWGIILIGWHDLDAVSMSDLMRCLHTALFSTLMAVVWVYLVDHPVLRPAFRALLRRAGLDGSEAERAALDELLASLRQGAAGLGEAWEGQRAALASLEEGVAAVRAEAGRFAEAGARAGETLARDLPAAVQALADRLAAAGESFEEREREFERAAEARARAADEALSARLDAQQKALDERLDAQQKALDERLADVRAVHAEFLEFVRGAAAHLADLRAAHAEQAAAAAQAAAEAETLRDRLAGETAAGNEIRAAAAQLRGDLAAERERLVEERERAERAESVLDRIHAAFGTK